MKTVNVRRSLSVGHLARAAVLSVAVFVLPAPADGQQSPGQSAPATGSNNTSTSSVWSEPRLLSKAIAWVEGLGSDEDAEASEGFYPELGHMITGAGWISAGPGYRRHLWKDEAVVDVSAAVSWRAYKIAQTRLEFPYLAQRRLTIGTQAFWQDYTQVRFFGVGRQSLETFASDYRVQATDFVTYASWRPSWKLAFSGSAGLLGRPGVSSSSGPFDRDEPDTTELFAGAPAAARTRQPRFLHGQLAVTFDNRDLPSYSRRGGLYRGAWWAFRDQADGSLSFDRWELEAAQFVPVARDRGVLALHWWAVLSNTQGDRQVPFYFLPSLGGHNTLRGYADYRFHDRHLIVANIESRWALMPHVDGAFFFDAGNVAARVRDLDFARTAYGFGLRLHTSRTTLVRLDVGRSEEGWRFILKLSDPLRMGRLARRTAPLPFVP